MSLYKIEVPVARTRVYYIEAASSYDALQHYLTGDGVYGELELDVDNENFIDFNGEDEIPEKATVTKIND